MSMKQRSTEELFEAYAALFSRAGMENLKREGRAVIEAARDGVYVTDAENRRYLDGDSSAGIFNLGRRNSLLVEELRQADRKSVV